MLPIATFNMQLLILTGFLGAGKTTILRTALDSGLIRQAAILVNEFGALDIDGALIAQSSPSALIRLPNGCVCCAVQDDFLDAVAGIAAHQSAATNVERIVLETSGLADPTPLLARLAGSRRTLSLIDDIRVVTVVDAVHGIALLDAHVEAVHQLACADVILVSKTDRVDPDRCQALIAALARRNPHATVATAVQGKVDERIWRRLFADAPRAGPSDDRRDAATQADPHARDFHDHPHSHSHGLASFVVRAGPVRSREWLQQWSSFLVMRYAESLLRIKGFVSDGPSGQCMLMQGALDGITFRPWSGPTSGSGTELVVIARHMDDQRVREGLRGVLAELDPSATVSS